jgi:hypothetical protein
MHYYFAMKTEKRQQQTRLYLNYILTSSNNTTQYNKHENAMKNTMM